MADNAFKLIFVKDDEKKWETLLNEIDKGNIIPVIGPDMLVEPKVNPSNGKVEDFHQQLISYIASQANLKCSPRTFSQLVYDNDFRHVVQGHPEEIYSLIYQILNNIDYIEDIDNSPSQLLIDLLSTKKFPFVITTSFCPIVENVMKDIWGDVKVLNFNNNPQDSLPERGGDITSIDDIKKPTVYYMFGKYCSSTDRRFVVTDSDMMTFCSSWIKGYGIPKRLVESLKKKYLLILGNNYSDWLFRFVWYGLRTSTNVMKSDVVVRENAEESLKQFMGQLETFYQENPTEVIKRIKNDIEKRSQDSPLSMVGYTYDVFISYSRKDEDVALNLYNSLVGEGLKVWFDNESIPKGKDWEKEIELGIRQSRLFVPILSKNVEQESFVPHEYRSEWNIASNLSTKMGERTFIVPLAQKTFDFYNPLTKIPSEFSRKNATWYSYEEDVVEIKEVLLRELKELEALESKLKQ